MWRMTGYKSAQSNGGRLSTDPKLPQLSLFDRFDTVSQDSVLTKS